MTRCKTPLKHADDSVSPCVRPKAHVLADTDHVDEHGHHAPVLVHQSTIREIEALAAYDAARNAYAPGLSYRTDENISSYAHTLPHVPYVPVSGYEQVMGDGRPLDSFGTTPQEAAFILGVRAAHADMAADRALAYVSTGDWYGRGYTYATTGRVPR